MAASKGAVPRSTHVDFVLRTGELWVFGGEQPCDDAGGSADIAPTAVRRFAPKDGTWKTLDCVGAAPRARIAAAAASVGGERLFLFGGFDPDDDRGAVGGSAGSLGYTNATHVLDTRSQPPRWRAVSAEGAAHAPSPRRDATLTWWPGVGGGTLLAFGGYDLLAVHADLHRFDLQTLEWSLVARGADADTSWPLPRRGHSATFVAGRMLVFGGCLGLSSYIDDLWAFDGTQWQALQSTSAATPSPRAWHTMTALDGRRLLLHGGRDADGCCDDVAWLLDLGDATNVLWTELQIRAGAAEPRFSHAVTLLNETLMTVHGGRNEAGELTGDVHHLEVQEVLQAAQAQGSVR